MDTEDRRAWQGKVCDKIISYGARGRISLTEDCKSNEHAEKLKIKADNYTLGVPQANSKSGIHPCFLQSRKDIQQTKLLKPLFLWIFLFARKHVLLG